MDLQNNPRLIIIIFFLLSALAWCPSFVFFIPGCLILFVSFTEDIDFFELLIYVLGLSLSYWMVLFWWLKYLPISLTSSFIITTVIVVLASGYFLIRKKNPYKISFSDKSIVLVLIFIFLGFLRFIPYFQLITPSGADMSWHTSISQLIINKNGVPDNYYPAFNINEFNSFPSGFQTISAIISMFGRLPGHRGSFIVTCITYLLLPLFLYLFLKKFVSWPFALASSISFSFYTLSPQGFISWGGNPTIFALDFLIFFMALLDKIEENKWLIIFSAFALASVFLSHTVVFIQAAYAFGISFLIFLILKKKYKFSNLSKYLLVLFILGLLCLPYLINLNLGSATPEIKSWIKSWVSNMGHDWHGTIFDFIWTIPWYIFDYVFGISKFRYMASAFSLLGIFIAIYKTQKRAIQYLVFAIICILIILNTKYWLLPFSYLIYPERTAVMIIIPMSFFFSFTLEKIFTYSKKLLNLSEKLYKALIFAMLFVVLMPVPLFNKTNYIQPITSANSVTPQDFKAIKWLGENTGPEDIIENNYGDAGLWIYPLISRAITNPHINIMYLYEVKPGANPTYVYIGKKCVYSCPLQDENFAKNPKYKKVYSEDGALIYKILN